MPTMRRLVNFALLGLIMALVYELVVAVAQSAGNTPTLTITPSPVYVGDSVSFLACGLQPSKYYDLAVWDATDTTLYADGVQRAGLDSCVAFNSDGFGGPFFQPTAAGDYSAYVYACSNRALACNYGSHLSNPVIDADFTVNP
jgi:hypothetical protein